MKLVSDYTHNNIFFTYRSLDWSSLKGMLGADMHYLFKGRLWENPAESQFRKEVRNIDWSDLCHELFDVRRDPFTGWRKQDWVCTDCMRIFMTDTLPRWWFQHKQRSKRFLKTLRKV